MEYGVGASAVVGFLHSLMPSLLTIANALADWQNLLHWTVVFELHTEKAVSLP